MQILIFSESSNQIQKETKTLKYPEIVYSNLFTNKESISYDLIQLDLLNLETYNNIIIYNKNGIESLKALANIINKDYGDKLIYITSKNINKHFDNIINFKEIYYEPINLLILIKNINKKSKNIIYKNIEIITKSHEVYINKKKVNLKGKEYTLFKYLVENSGRVITNEEIKNNVWKLNYCYNNNTIRTYISNIRRKLNQKQTKYIQTMHGYGYKV